MIINSNFIIQKVICVPFMRVHESFVIGILIWSRIFYTPENKNVFRFDNLYVVIICRGKTSKCKYNNTKPQ